MKDKSHLLIQPQRHKGTKNQIYKKLRGLVPSWQYPVAKSKKGAR
jgi:hypothetical protein